MMSREDLMIECDMLEGNVNRMMVTDDIRELEKMYATAVLRLTNIFANNKVRIKEIIKETIREIEI